MRHGSRGGCLLAPDESGRVLDRLAGLEKVITMAIVRQVLRRTGRVNTRACVLTHEITLWIVLAMGLFTNVPIRQVFKRTRFARVGEATPGRSALCQARRRLGVAPVRRLFVETVRPLATVETPGAFYKGYRLMGIDGVVYNLPDRPVLERIFGRPSGGDRGEGAFPQIRKVSLVELGTHVETAFVVKPISCGEPRMTVALVKHVPDDALLIQDRGFFSYKLWKAFDSRGVKLLDEKSYPATELICLYHERWEEELMFEAAERQQLDSDRLSFTGCFQILQCRLPECNGHSEQSLDAWYDSLLWELGHEQIEPRRNRINPRVIKQKLSKWPKKQPQHRRPPPLTKTFAESIVVTN